MPRKTVIDRLPKEIREKIGELRDRGRTIDEILAALRALDVDLTRSTLGLHIKKLDQVAERIRRSRDVADALVRRVGEAGENKQLRLNVELMHSVIMDLFSADDGKPVAIDPESAMFLARSLRDLATATKTDAEHVLKVRDAAAKETKEKAIAAVDELAKTGEKGLSRDTVAAIRAKILGIQVGAP